MVFLATALPVFSFNTRADSADGPQTNPQLQAAIETVLKETKSSAWRQQSVRRIIRRFASLGIFLAPGTHIARTAHSTFAPCLQDHVVDNAFATVPTARLD